MTKKAVVRTAEWTNGIGIRVQGAYQFDEESRIFVFRIIGREDGFTLPVEFTYPREYKEYIEKYGFVITRGIQSISFSVHTEMQRHCKEWAEQSDFDKILKATFAISSKSSDVYYQLLNKKHFKSEFGTEKEVENPRNRQ